MPSFKGAFDDLGSTGFGGALTAGASVAISVLPLPTIASVTTTPTGATIVFSTQVAFSDTAFSLTKSRAGTIGIVVTSQVVAGKTVVSLTYTGSLVNADGSLQAGKYTLKIVGTQVSNAALLTQKLDANNAGVSGGTYVDPFLV